MAQNGYFNNKNNVVIILLAIVHISSASECEACLNNYCYYNVPILPESHISDQIAIDRTMNTIYFYYWNTGKFISAAYNLDSGKFFDVPNADFNFANAIAVNENTHDVYITNFKHLYKFNPIKNYTELIAIENQFFRLLQFKDRLYYIDMHYTGIFTYKKKTAKKILSGEYEIYDFIIDSRDDIYFADLKRSFTFKWRRDDNFISVFDYNMLYLATDRFGNAYFYKSMTRTLYTLDYNTDRVIDVGVFKEDQPTEFVFDKDNNIVYRNLNDDHLYHLIATNEKCAWNGSSIVRETDLSYKYII